MNHYANGVIQEWQRKLSPDLKQRSPRSSLKHFLKSQGREFNQSIGGCYNSVSLSYAVPCGGEDIDKN